MSNDKKPPVPTRDSNTGGYSPARPPSTPVTGTFDYSESNSRSQVIRNTVEPPKNPNNTGGGKGNQK